uniref:RLF zinc finger n=1 Tax=Callorhinchus milii TaxID=7868 RepID=A0A4W3JBC9_CALMI
MSLPADEVPQGVWQQLQQTLQESHNVLMDYGNNDLQALLAISVEGGAWRNKALRCILSRETVEAEEVKSYLTQEGPVYLEIRIKHLLKSDRTLEAMLLAKCCTETPEISSKGTFRQIYLTCLCSTGPNEEAAEEITRIDCKEVLDIICNLESEGQENTAFILCTTFLTHQLQQESVYCSWELTLFWSKLQRRMDPSLDSFLERCRQLGISARTVYHIFFLIKVIQSEAEGAGLPISIELCVGALRIQSNTNSEMQISICKTIACLMPEDLEVRRACQLTQFLLEPGLEAYREVERLYNQPDQKCNEENGPIPNSLRCELLLALKAHWPFDPEFWDWKTLKRHCRGQLGDQATEISEDELSEDEPNDNELFDQMSRMQDLENERRMKEQLERFTDVPYKKKEKVMSERYYRWLQNMFFCVLCKKDYVVARIVHHAKTHVRDGIFSCPICAKKFKKKELFTPHVKEHIKKPKRERKPKKKEDTPKLTQALFNVATSPKPQPSPQASEPLLSPWTESYPCPGTDCSRSFKYYKNLTAHLKNDHLDNDDNVRHFLEMNNRKALCKYCRRHFVSDFHLKAHLKVHSGLQPYICIQMDCNASFQAFAELVRHRKQHKEFRSKCTFKGCSKVFSGSCLLYHHEAQHYREAAYSCNTAGCKKFYFSKSEFENHLQTHGITNWENPNLCGGEVLNDVAGKSLQSCSSSLAQRTEEGEINATPARCPSNSCHSGSEGGGGDQGLVSETKPGKSNSPSVYSENLLVPLEKLASFKELSDIEDMMKAATLHPELNRAANQNCRDLTDVLAHLHHFICGVDGCVMRYTLAKELKKHVKVAHPSYYKGKRQIKEECGDVVDVSTLQGSQEQAAASFSNPKSLGGHLARKIKSLVDEKVCASTSASTSLGVISIGSVSLPAPPTNASSHNSQSDLSNEGSGIIKPFVCDHEGCVFKAMTKDGLVNHYVKTHKYARDKVLQLNRFQLRFAPFKCHICLRTFTRKTNLRTHYKQMHMFSKEDMKNARHSMECGDWRQSGSDSENTTNESFTTELESSESTESLKSEEMHLNGSPETGSVPLDSADDSEFKEEGRGSRRVGAKTNLCYMLNKYHKPYHCIHKGCTAAFTGQPNLIRHYQTVHQYNREQMCLEAEQGSAKKDNAKVKKIFKCKIEGCTKRFQYPRVLLRHYSEIHSLPGVERRKHPCNQPDCISSFNAYSDLRRHLQQAHDVDYQVKRELGLQFKCSIDGCSRTYSIRSSYLRHVQRQHKNHYKSILLRPRRHVRLVSEGQVRFRIRQQRPKTPVEFRAKEHGFAICKTELLRDQFPCMVLGCRSVVLSRHSAVRHYKTQHKMTATYINQNCSCLLVCKKYPDATLREKLGSDPLTLPKKVLSEPNEETPSCSVLRQQNGEVPLKLEIKNEPDAGGHGQPLHSCSVGNGNSPSCGGGFPGKAVNASATGVTNWGPSFKENDANQVFLPKNGGILTNLVKQSGNQNGSLFVKLKQPQKRKSETEGQPQRTDPCVYSAVTQDSLFGTGNLQDSADPPPKPFDLTTYKPIGFEASFLKFIQESEETEPEVDESWHWEPTKRCRSNTPQNESRIDSGLRGSGKEGYGEFNADTAVHSTFTAIQPLISPGQSPTLENLRTILDKALTDCGDLALKQLHFLRPVVVLERSEFSTPLIELFPTKKSDELCVGSS